MSRLVESIRRCAIALLLLLSLCPLQKAHAVVGTLDPVPAATLLYPYFEVDLSNANGKTTAIGLQNTSATAILARATIWSNTGVPVYNFNIYLTGFDAVSFDMRAVLNGNLPQTASYGQDPSGTISPKGLLSQDINFASCNGILPYGAVSSTFVAELKSMLTGNASTTEFPGQCVGTNSGDNVARGYLTIDTVNSCSTSGFPVGPTGDASTAAEYFDGTGNSRMTSQNVLLGDYMLINQAQHVLITNNATSIEASPGIGNYGYDGGNAQTTTSGNYTFYGAFENWTANDNREPLPTQWNVAGDTGNGSAIIWRDPKVSSPAAFACAGQPAYAPLGQNGIRFFDRASIYTVIPTPPSVPNPSPPPLPNFAPVATQIVPFNSTTMLLPTTTKMGFIDMDLNGVAAIPGPNPPVDATVSQSLVVVLNSNENQANYSSGVTAVPTNRPRLMPTFEITVNNQQADNTTQDVVTVAYKDVNGGPVGGITVHFTVAAPATLTSPTCMTNYLTGLCTVGITSATAGSYAVNLTGPSVAGPLNAVFVGPPDSSKATFQITTDYQPANGVAKDMATVTLLDASNTPAGGIPVNFTVDAGATLVNSSCTTGNNGQCSVGVQSLTVGGYAVNVTAPFALGPQNANFVTPPDASKSTLAITVDNQPAGGNQYYWYDQATVTLLDSGSNPVGGTVVTFAVAAPVTLVSNTCTTDGSGQCSVRLISPNPGSFAVNVTLPISLGPQNATFN